MVKYKEEICKLKGWLEPRAINLFEHLGIVHARNNINGDILEIGTYHGKSTCALGQLLVDKEVLHAVDTFVGYNRKEFFLDDFKSNWNRFVTRNIEIHKCKSDELDFEESKKFRIIHIDGDHSFECTFKDLILANRHLEKTGVIIIDDFLNQDWLGVNQALNRFLTDYEYCVFALGYNKTLICRTEDYKIYIEDFKTDKFNISPHNMHPFHGYNYLSLK